VLVNAVASHHGETEQNSVYAVLCTAADAISSSRPGARNESTEIYVERIEKLEKIAKSRKGVKSAFAIQAGRELRVIVDPDVLNDNDAMLLAQEISRAIEAELRYPGQIRIVVIREQRCLEYAR
jgi:ribonuclease Y